MSNEISSERLEELLYKAEHRALCFSIHNDADMAKALQELLSRRREPALTGEQKLEDAIVSYGNAQFDYGQRWNESSEVRDGLHKRLNDARERLWNEVVALRSLAALPSRETGVGLDKLTVGHIRHTPSCATDGWLPSSEHRPPCDCGAVEIAKALRHLSAPSTQAECATCNDTKIVDNGGSMNYGEFITLPCPDCDKAPDKSCPLPDEEA
jgi:hypothetical protein